MNTSSENLKKEFQNYIIAVLKSSAMGLTKELKELIIKADPMMTVKQILAKLKK